MFLHALFPPEVEIDSTWLIGWLPLTQGTCCIMVSVWLQKRESAIAASLRLAKGRALRRHVGHCNMAMRCYCITKSERAKFAPKSPPTGRHLHTLCMLQQQISNLNNQFFALELHLNYITSKMAVGFSTWVEINVTCIWAHIVLIPKSSNHLPSPSNISVFARQKSHQTFALGSCECPTCLQAIGTSSRVALSHQQYSIASPTCKMVWSFSFCYFIGLWNDSPQF